MTTRKMIKILTCNLGRSKAAHALIERTAAELQASIIICPEPNKKIVSNGNWFIDERKDTAIRVINKDIRVLNTIKGCGYVQIELLNIVIYGCYISPNIPLEDFATYLASLKNSISLQRKKVILVGDFNAKSRLWGSHAEDRRGDMLIDWMASDQLLVINDGVHPTFVRGTSKSFIDLTITSPGVKVSDWKVYPNKESLSYHLYIAFVIDQTESTVTEDLIEKPIKTWRFNEKNSNNIKEIIREEFSNSDIYTAEKMKGALTHICDKSLSKSCINRKRTPVHWWSEEIKLLRQQCIRAKRTVTRANRKLSLSIETKEGYLRAYSEKRKILKNSIEKAKKDCWHKLLKEMDNDIWGKAYQIVTNKKGNDAKITLTHDRKMDIAKTLFPSKQLVTWSPLLIEDPIRLFSPEELKQAMNKIKNGKATGPDGLPTEVIKLVEETRPDMLLKMYNKYLVEGKFPIDWKKARLVLLEKPLKAGQMQRTYRPLCILDVLGKVYERLLLNRLESEMRVPLSPSQYGFRKGCSTITAAKKVLEMANEAKNNGLKKLCCLIAVDVKNAFNSAPWHHIVSALKRKGVPFYLLNILQDYFSDRKLLIDHQETSISCGVPQGSILGPFLWNCFYDEILEVIDSPNVKSIGYADDLALIITESDKDVMEAIAERTFQQVLGWMDSNGLEVATEKTEAVLLVSKRRTRQITIRTGYNSTITTKEAIKYLGIWIERDIKMIKHLNEAVIAGEKRCMMLGKLMPNFGGPNSTTRRVLGSIIYSQLLYGAPVWCNMMNWQKYRTIMDKASRKVTLRICSGYRTMSTIAAEVISGCPPFRLKAEEAVNVFNGMDKAIAKEITFAKWQERWVNENQDKASWTRRLIPDVRRWCERRHGEVNFFLTQFLSGHGNFGSYLKRFKLKDTDRCSYCNEEDTPEHIVFRCQRFNAERESSIGVVEPEGLADFILSNPQNWSRMDNLVRVVMMTKV